MGFILDWPPLTWWMGLSIGGSIGILLFGILFFLVTRKKSSSLLMIGAGIGFCLSVLILGRGLQSLLILVSYLA